MMYCDVAICYSDVLYGIRQLSRGRMMLLNYFPCLIVMLQFVIMMFDAALDNSVVGE